MESSQLLGLHLLPSLRYPAYNGSCSTDCVGLGFRFGLFLLGDGLNLIEIATENGRIGNVFGGF